MCDTLTPAAEKGWTGFSIYDDEDLKNTLVDCRQCHQLQAPTLKRVLEARAAHVSVVDVDAPDEPELAQRYQVLTVPTTVVLDAKGRAHAVNYGFANSAKLLEQVDEVLGR